MATLSGINRTLEANQRFILFELTKSQNRTEREIGLAYKNLFATINKDLSTLYRKVGKDNPSISDVRKYNRLGSLLKNVKIELDNFHKVLNKGLDKHAVITAKAALDGFAWSLQNAIGLSLNFNLQSSIATEIAKESPFYFLAKRKLYNDNLTKIRNVLNQGFYQGKSYVQLSRDLSKAVGTNYTQSRRIVRTETHRIYEQAHNEEFVQSVNMGIDTKMKLLAVIDNRTRQQSFIVNGEISNDEGKFKYPDGNYYIPGSTGRPDWDIYDRERSIQIVDGIEPKQRFIREQGRLVSKNKERKIIQKRLAEFSI